MTEKDILAYEKQRNGRIVLVLLGLVTAVNLILTLVGLTNVVFPLSFFVSRFLFTLEAIPKGTAIAAAVVLCLALFLMQTAAGNKQFAHLRVFRTAFILYIADSFLYFGMTVASITANRGQLAFIIELAFRLYCIYAMYVADKQHGNPARYDKPSREDLEKLSQKQASAPVKDDEDDEDEGIQW